MTDQQEHLSNFIQQYQKLKEEITLLNNQLLEKKETLLKIQGIIEYLQKIGVTLSDLNENPQGYQSLEPEEEQILDGSVM